MATSYHRVRLMEATKSRLRASTPADWSTWPIAWPSWPWAWEVACRQLDGVDEGSLALARSWKQVEKPPTTWSAAGAGRWAAWSWPRRRGTTTAIVGWAWLDSTPEKNTRLSSRPLTNARSPNRLSTTSGELSLRVLRRSYSANIQNTGTDAAMSRNVQAGQPRSRPSTSG